MPRKQKNTQTSYTVIGILRREDDLFEVEGTTHGTYNEAVAQAKADNGHAMIRENRIVWLSKSLEVAMLEIKVKRDLEARREWEMQVGKSEEDRV